MELGLGQVPEREPVLELERELEREPVLELEPAWERERHRHLSRHLQSLVT